jgi:hypothetical protein
VKIALGSGAALPTRIGATPLGADENYCQSSVTYGQYLFLGTGYGSINNIIKIDMGLGATLPTRLNAVTLNAGEEEFSNGAVINGPAGKAVFGYGGDNFGGLVKINIGELLCVLTLSVLPITPIFSLYLAISI